jgi:prepilin-type N-terminal cleavage/methylation domain-containing protein
MFKKRVPKKNDSGFTLIELMVSVAIFAIVTLITSGSFIVLANIYRKVQSNRAIIDNLNLAMDTMALQIREGRDYRFVNCGSNTINKCIKFNEYMISGDKYEFVDEVMYYVGAGDNVLYQKYNKEPLAIPLTSKEITVDDLSFIPSTNRPQRVTVIIKGEAHNKEGLSSDFLLQTTLTQRNRQDS